MMDGYAVKKTLFPSTTPALDRRRAGPIHQWAASSKQGEYAAATTHTQWSSLCSLSWILDHELLRYQCLKNSAKCFSVPPRPGATSFTEQQVERCDRVYMHSAVMTMTMRSPLPTTMEDVSSQACADLCTIGIDSLLVLEDPLTHIKRHAVVDSELFRLMMMMTMMVVSSDDSNSNYVPSSDGDSSSSSAIAGAAVRSSKSNLLRWEEGSRWNVALSRCASSSPSSAMQSSSEEAAIVVLSALSYDELTSGCGDADDTDDVVHLTWRVVWMDRVA